ncbi:MAG TPA: iron ABC transporter permease [Symbiobacteriaceae bacterium]|nr:iron ABC transporter permease [Symbiobacteriaceae bacterium]
MTKLRGRGWTWIGLGAALFLVLFLLWPTLRLTAASLASGESYVRFFAKPYYYEALLNSLWLSTAATLGSILIGVPLAVLVARHDIVGKGFIRTAAVLSLLSPPFIGAYAWILLLGRAGFIPKLLGLQGVSIYGAGGVLFVFIIHHFAYVFLLTATALTRIDPALEEAAETMGVRPFRRLLTVTLPLCWPSIAAGALLVFTTTLADFGTPMLIGEGMRTLPILVYNEFLSEVGGNAGMASDGSVIMLAIALGALALQGWTLRGRNYAMHGLRTPAIRPLPGMVKASGIIFGWLVAAIAILPQAVVVVTSFIRARGPLFTGEFGLDNYRVMLDRMASPILNTLWFAAAATAVMLAAGMAVGYLLVRRPGPVTRLVDGLLILAQVLPGTVLGIGLLLTWGRPPLALTGTGAILIIAYIVRRIAYTVRSAAAGLRQITPAVEEASLTLGAPPGRTFWRITAPLMLPAALAGAMVSWVSTLSELSSTIMLYTGRTATVSIQIYNQVMNDSFGAAAALGSVLTVLTVATLWLTGRYGARQDGLQL